MKKCALKRAHKRDKLTYFKSKAKIPLIPPNDKL